MAMHQAAQIADYYDRNTRGIKYLSRRMRRLAIHRSVWAPGVKNRTQAVLYVNRRIEEHAIAVDAEKILDLGCGVGGSLIDLALSRPARYAGVTVSRTQKRIGDELILKQGLQDQIRIFEGDFSDPKVFRLFPNQDLIYAVESLIHLSPENDIAPMIQESLTSGGRFILCDEMLSAPREEFQAEDRRLLELYTGSRFANGLRSSREWIGIFEEAGLEPVAAEDFSSRLKFSVAKKIVAPIAGKISRGRPGKFTADALFRQLLKRGILQYRFLVFRQS